ncbi:MAG: 50S ribosomal protein L10 [Patescibacteria group bacterium]
MARTKTQKKEIIEKLGTIMGGAKSLVFVNIHGLKLEEATKMRRALKKEGVGFFVAKKSLTSLALKNKKYEGTAVELVGEFGFAYGADLVAPARGVYEFQKTHKDQVAIIGGVFENKFTTKDEMIAIASIPPLQTLYGMFVNVINSPIQGLVIALDQVGKNKVV